MPIKRIAIVSLVLVFSLFLAACDQLLGGAEPTLPPPVVDTEPADPAESADASTSADLAAFKSDLIDALMGAGLPSRDYTRLQTFMGESFSISGWGSSGTEWSAAEAASRLETIHLTPTATPSADLNADIQSILDGADPFTFFPVSVGFIYMDGWDSSVAGLGPAEAILVIAQNANGSYYWDSVLIADAGFAWDRGPTAGDTSTTSDSSGGLSTTDYNTFESALLAALTSGARDYTHISTFMGDPFAISGWLMEGTEYTPADAAARLQTTFLPQTAFMGYQSGIDIASILGTDPFSMFPGATNFIFTTGWESDGTAEAILIIAQNSDGTYYWSSVLVAPGGFSATTTTGSGEDIALFEFKIALGKTLGGVGGAGAVTGRVYSDIQAHMASSLFLSFTDAPGGRVGAASLVADLASHVLPPGTESAFMADLDRDYTALANASDPLGPTGLPGMVGYFWSTGWGSDGTQDALVLIGQAADGRYEWIGLYTSAAAITP